MGRNQVFAWWLAFCMLAAIPRDIFPIARIPRVSAQSRHGAAPRCRQVGRSAKLQGSGRAYEQGVESPRVAARLPCLALDLSKLCCNRILQPFPWALGQGAWAATGEVTQGYGRSSPVMSEGNAGPENGKGVKGLPEPREPPVLRKDGLGCFPPGSDYLPRNWVGIFAMPDSPSASPAVTGEREAEWGSDLLGPRPGVTKSCLPSGHCCPPRVAFRPRCSEKEQKEHEDPQDEVLRAGARRRARQVSVARRHSPASLLLFSGPLQQLPSVSRGVWRLQAAGTELQNVWKT